MPTPLSELNPIVSTYSVAGPDGRSSSAGWVHRLTEAGRESQSSERDRLGPGWCSNHDWLTGLACYRARYASEEVAMLSKDYVKAKAKNRRMAGQNG
jgi:hypothetical protein